MLPTGYRIPGSDEKVVVKHRRFLPEFYNERGIPSRTADSHFLSGASVHAHARSTFVPALNHRTLQRSLGITCLLFPADIYVPGSSRSSYRSEQQIMGDKQTWRTSFPRVGFSAFPKRTIRQIRLIRLDAFVKINDALSFLISHRLRVAAAKRRRRRERKRRREGKRRRKHVATDFGSRVAADDDASADDSASRDHAWRLGVG